MDGGGGTKLPRQPCSLLTSMLIESLWHSSNNVVVLVAVVVVAAGEVVMERGSQSTRLGTRCLPFPHTQSTH